MVKYIQSTIEYFMAKKECIRMDIFKIIEIGLMIGLWGISIFCMLDVFKKFKSEDSSFKQYQEPMLEHPTVFICFNPPQKNITYELDFHILSDQNVLHIGNNTNANNDTVMLEEIKTLFYQNCYGVSTISSSPLRHAYKILQVEFNNTSIATNISTHCGLKKSAELNFFFLLPSQIRAEIQTLCVRLCQA